MARSKRHDLGGFLFPVRVEHLFLQQVRANLLQPLRAQCCRNAPAEQARGLHQFGLQTIQRPGFLRQVRAGVGGET